MADETAFDYMRDMSDDERVYSGRMDRWLIHAFMNTSSSPRNNRPWFERRIAKTFDDKFGGEPVVIGITGLAGSGKDSATDYLFGHAGGNYDLRVTRTAFAFMLKKVARLFFDDKQLTNRELKEKPDEFWGISPRQFLQMCGTEMFRNVWRDDIWVKCTERVLNELSSQQHETELRFGGTSATGKYRIIFVTDVRFPNEAEMIKSRGGYIVRVERPDNPNHISETHDSERFIETLPVDLTITNDCANAEEWSWQFAKRLTQFFDPRAFY